MKIRVSDLKHRLSLQKTAGAQNSLGSQSGDWQQQIVERAKIVYQSSKEALSSDQMAASTACQIIVRYHGGVAAVSAAWRCVDLDTNQVFHIVGPPQISDGAPRWLILKAELRP